MNDQLLKGELLREAACVGDQESLVQLLQQGVDVNSTNSVNGWTALHWACRRGRVDAVRHLCAAGASPDVINSAGETPSQLTTDPALLNILAGGDGKRVSTDPAAATATSPTPTTTATYPTTTTATTAATAQPDSAGLSMFTPSYLRFPTRKVDLGDGLLPTTEQTATTVPSVDEPPVQSDRKLTVTDETVRCRHCCRCCPVYNRSCSDELVLKVRVSSVVGCDPDFIELELPRSDLTWDRLLRVCCRELNISTQVIERVRKLPNTRLRCDGDVSRLQDYQELELVLRAPSNSSNNSSSNSFNNSIPSHLLY